MTELGAPTTFPSARAFSVVALSATVLGLHNYASLSAQLQGGTSNTQRAGRATDNKFWVLIVTIVAMDKKQRSGSPGSGSSPGRKGRSPSPGSSQNDKSNAKSSKDKSKEKARKVFPRDKAIFSVVDCNAVDIQSIPFQECGGFDPYASSRQNNANKNKKSSGSRSRGNSNAYPDNNNNTNNNSTYFSPSGPPATRNLQTQTNPLPLKSTHVQTKTLVEAEVQTSDPLEFCRLEGPDEDGWFSNPEWNWAVAADGRAQSVAQGVELFNRFMAEAGPNMESELADGFTEIGNVFRG
jgi:hypothetical protein